MKLKKHWNGQYGKSAFIKNGTLGMIELDMLKLREGEQKHYYETDNKEYGLIILGGKCSVVGEGFSFEHIGKRKNVFDGPAASVYLPKNCDFNARRKRISRPDSSTPRTSSSSTSARTAGRGKRTSTSTNGSTPT